MLLSVPQRRFVALASLSVCACVSGKPLALEAHGVAQATTANMVEVDSSMEELVVRLLTRDGKNAPTPENVVKEGLRKIDVKSAARRLEGTLPSDLASMVKFSVDDKAQAQAETQQPFAESSLAKARKYLNQMVEKAWKELDDKLINCKEYEDKNRGAFEQVITDIARIAEQIADLERLKSETTEMGNVKEQEIIVINAQLKKETLIYNKIFMENSAEMTIRKNDLAVFQFMMGLVKCKSSSLLQQGRGPEVRICDSNGSLELHFDDKKLQADLERKMTPGARAALQMVLDKIEAVDAEQAAVELKQEKLDHDNSSSDDNFDDSLDDDGAEKLALSDLGVGATTITTTTAGLPTPPAAKKTPVQKEVSEEGGAFKCPVGPPDCGLLHDKMSLMWGKFKDLVDELQATMDKNEFAFNNLKNSLNQQIEVMRNSKARFNIGLNEAVANLAADREEMAQKEAERQVLEKEYKDYMKACKKRIEWIMYQDMCSYLKVRATVMKFSKVSPPDKITDCGLTAWVPSQCSVPCDDTCPDKTDPYKCGGFQTLTREVVVPANEFGLKCPMLERKRKCGQVKCPVDCRMSRWSSWSKCTRECEGGAQGRTRSILTVAKNGGASCSTAQESRPCNTGSCDRDCSLKKWSKWTPCSVACGGGFQERWRRVTRPIRGKGKCPKPKSSHRYGLQNCNVHACNGDEVCIAKQDLIMAIDGSGSLTDKGFKIVKNFVSKLVGKYLGKYYGFEDMRIGVIQFGNGQIMPDGSIAQAVEVSPLTSDIAKVKTAIDGMKFMKGFTNMAQAFTLTEKLQLLGGRTTAQSAVLTITDGKPSFLFQTNERVMQMKDKHTKLFFMPITEFKGEEMKLMKQWASSPWETHLVHVPGLLPLAADENIFAQKAIVKFCPESLSPSGVTVQEKAQGYMLIRENGRCGTRGVMLGTVDGGVAACAALAEGAKKTAFSFGIKFARGRCFAEELAVTPAMITMFRKARADPPCPAGNWVEDGLYDFYVLETLTETTTTR